MKQPKSKLPWSINVFMDDYDEDMIYEITPSDGEKKWDGTVLPIIESKPYYPVAPEQEDAEYIVEACNNYPKVVQYLRELIEAIEDTDDRLDFIYSAKYGGKYIKEIKQFLDENT